MPKQLKILLVEDSETDAELIEVQLSEVFGSPKCKRVFSREDLESNLESFKPDLIISDYSMPGFTGVEALEICRAKSPDTPFIFVSGTIGEERAVAALKNGASDYVLKSSLSRLPHAAKTAVRIALERVEKREREIEIKRLSTVAREINNGVWIGSYDLETVWVNEAFIKQTGYTLAELKVLDGRELFFEFDKKKAQSKEWLSELWNGRSIVHEIRMQNKSGTYYWIIMHMTPVFDENNTLSQIVVITTDITNRKIAEQERDELLSTLEVKVKQRTEELDLAYNQLVSINKDLTDSIRYASYIQQAFIPPFTAEKIRVPNAFIMAMPRDILSGDFHWQRDFPERNMSYVAIGDCTGHGVPGSLMTMLAIQFLEQQIVETNAPAQPGEILHAVDHSVINFLRQEEEGSLINDGMEIMLICINHKKRTLHFSGARRPLNYFSKGQFELIKTSKSSVGGTISGQDKVFKTKVIPFQQGDRLYVFSDGFADQFGGPDLKKYGQQRKTAFLKGIQNTSFLQHQSLINTEIKLWKGNNAQTDDIIALGIEF